MRSLQEIDALRNARNVRAFLEAVAQPESGGRWNVLAGGGEFLGQIYPLDEGKAAGKFQIIPSTWKGLVEKRPHEYGLRVFDPATQERMALDLLDGRGALDDVVAGRLREAVDKASWEWAALPGPDGKTRYPPNNRAVSFDKVRQVFLANGGVEEGGQAPVVPVEETEPMAIPLIPILGAFLPALIEAAPKLASLFDGKTPVRDRNVAAAIKVAEIAQQVTASPNLQAAVEEISSKPEARQKFIEAIDAAWPTLVEVGGGIGEARKWNADAAGMPPWRMPAIWMSIALLPLVYMTAGAVLWGEGWPSEVRSATATLIIGAIIGSLTGFFFGSSYGSAKKDGLAVAQARQG